MQQLGASLLADSAAQAPSIDELERYASRSPTVALCLIVGLPGLGILTSLVFGLPLFASLMSGSLLLATALVCRKALIWFTTHTLRLLVTARLVIVLVLGALLFCATGSAWMAVVSTLLLWLTTDRLLGRRALHDLGRSARTDDTSSEVVPAAISESNGAATQLFSSARGAADPGVRSRRQRRAKD